MISVAIEGHSPTHVFTVPSLYHLCAKILQSHSMESSSQRSPAISFDLHGVLKLWCRVIRESVD